MPESQDGGPAALNEGGSSANTQPSEKKRKSRRRRRGRRRGAKANGSDASGSGNQAQDQNKVDNQAASTSSTSMPQGSPPRGQSQSQPKRKTGKVPGRRPKPARGRFAHTYAALDLGTNNCRLLVARPQNEGFKIIDAFSRTVRLGQGLRSGGDGVVALTGEAMDRAVEALTICAEKMKRRGVTRARCIATEACRTAANGEAFIARVKKETGLDLEIITPQKEASLAVSGCAPLLDTNCEAAMVFDIGGGSTELVWLDLKPMKEAAKEPKILAWTSLPFGVVTLAETYLDRKPQTPEEETKLFDELVGRVRTEIDNFTGAADQRALYDTSAAHLIGNSGTVTTLAAVHLGLRSYDRRRVDGLWIKGNELYDLVSRLSNLGFDGRAKIPSVGEDRADLLFPGCAILRAIQDTWPSGRVRVADRGLREGILVELMEKAEKEGRGKRRTRRGRRGGQRRKSDNNAGTAAGTQSVPTATEAAAATQPNQDQG